MHGIMDNEMEIRIRHWADQFYGKYQFRLIPVSESGGLKIDFEQSSAVIRYDKPVQFFRGAAYVKEWITNGASDMKSECAAGASAMESEYAVRENPVFEHLTYMADCSRNAVCSVEWLKQLIPKLAALGYDRLMLYTEDTYEIEGEPFFGYLRGRYSKEELRELDDTAWSYGIELVPCIQTLAHLNAIFRWSAYQNVNDTGDILCCGTEETYRLIDRMAVTLADSFHSRTIHIGMDEAELVGRGSYLKKFGYEERITVMERHLKKVMEIFRRYGFESFMIWSDMYFKILTNGGYYDSIKEIPEGFSSRIPDGVELVYWDYYTREKSGYDRMLDLHQAMCGQIGFAGGAWKWTGFAPLNRHSFAASRAALDSCREHGIRNIIVTGWGDDGSEAAQSSVLPVLSLFAEFQYTQRTDDAWISRRLRTCTGADLADFLLLDDLNLVPDNPAPGQIGIGPAKYLLYQDLLMGIFDAHIQESMYAAHYRNCARQLREAEQRNEEYRYIFSTLASLAEVLERKADLGVRIRNAYHADNRVKLAEYAEECEELCVYVEHFHNDLRKQWMYENKAFGLEIQDIRLGGLKERIRRTGERLIEYLAGDVSEIEELESEVMRLSPAGEFPGESRWERIVTAGVM